MKKRRFGNGRRPQQRVGSQVHLRARRGRRDHPGGESRAVARMESVKVSPWPSPHLTALAEFTRKDEAEEGVTPTVERCGTVNGVGLNGGVNGE